MTRATKTTGGWNYGSPPKSEIEVWRVTNILIDFIRRNWTTLKYSPDQLIEDLQSYPDREAVSAITDMIDKRVIEEFEELARIGKVAFLQSFVKARLAQLKSKAPEEDS